jgi:asparagine N-glycosylation enzyme membrane subunit Stt3
MSLIGTAIIAFLSIIVPGFFLALALLKKTKLNMFEITTIGFIFGLIFPPAMTWVESYLMDYVHFFSFSAGLYAANVVILTIVGVLLSVQQGAIDLGFMKKMSNSQVESEMRSNYKDRLQDLRRKLSTLNADINIVKLHEREEEELERRHAEEFRNLKDVSPEAVARLKEMHLSEEKRLIEAHEREERMLLRGKPEKKSINVVWLALLFLMLFTFATRMMSIGIAPKFFEFDPYFDMQSTEFLVIHGYQWLYDTSAWPTVINGTPHRIEPLVPYLEAYWYEISNPPADQISLTLMSDVSSFYPAIVAALLVFMVFMFLYHTYGEIPAIIGAGLATAMPALITTFIAGEQLLEPWGIFAMFFFYVAYLLAVQNMKDVRFAILAGIAFASSFLGAHYYTVIAGVFAIYIALQGVIDVFRKKDMKDLKDFYKMNLIVIGIIVLFYLIFDPYNTVLTDKIPGVFGIPVIISFPLLALALVALLDYGPKLTVKYKLAAKANLELYLAWLGGIAVLGILLILFTSVGSSIRGYLALSSHFTTPSISLFMTVQEYAPTGFNFDFGSAGFGPIGLSIFGVDAIVWLVMILFTGLAALAIYKRDSKASILAIAAVWPLAIAAMIEIKYLPHFGVGYIIAFCMILGELLLFVKDSKGLAKNAILGFGIFIVLLEFSVFIGMFGGIGQSCSTISSQDNAMGYSLFCNVVPNSWLAATSWMKQNVGPLAPRILSWWDYGDWINWFGNSNAVLRGDNSLAKLDYMTAARYVLGEQDGFGPANLTSYMNNVVQSKYIIFDDQLTQKWQALNFLACVDTNQTSRAYAIQQANGTTSPYALGTSQCELSHVPAYLLVPTSSSDINNYCQIANKSTSALKARLLAGNGITNETYCVPMNESNSNVIHILDSNGNATNILLVPTSQFFAGVATLGGQQVANFMVLYLPNGPNDTITNAPTKFYDSNYYRGFYLGKLPGFTPVFPSNFTGINYVNGTYPVVIYALNNYTGALPNVTAKPSWVVNNFTMPG